MDNISPDYERHSKCRSFLKDLLLGFVTEYETPKIVTIHSYTITTLLRILQAILLFYTIFYLFLHEKGYQKQDTSIISSITLKVKGIGFIQTETNDTYALDGTDYIIPASENNAIFIMTNFVQTDQSRSECTESSLLTEAVCKYDSDCQNKSYLLNVNGRWTGRCIVSMESNQTSTNSTGLCELEGWCPVEDDRKTSTVIKEVVNFTLFIKNFIEFPLFHVKHKNMVENLKSCVFHPTLNPDCPIFRLDYILNEAESDEKERELMLRLGGVIRVKIDWDCNLDRKIKLCKPKYSFARLDTRFREETFSVGFNFRFSSNWKYNHVYFRSLKKAYGLRFIISVSGRAGKFDFITLSLNVGSVIGVFGLATFFCDLILLNLSKKASVYRNYVFQRVRLEERKRSQALQNKKNLKDDKSTVYINPTIENYKLTSSYLTTDTMVGYTDIVPSLSLADRTDRFQWETRLGLTNSIN